MGSARSSVDPYAAVRGPVGHTRDATVCVVAIESDCSKGSSTTACDELAGAGWADAEHDASGTS